MRTYIDLSLGIPAKNSAPFLGELFQSIGSQQHCPREIIFIDDASEDSTCTLARQFKESNPDLPIRILRHETTYGIARSYNQIISESSSCWTQILDADDFLVSAYYTQVAQHLQSDYAAIITGVQSNLILFSILNRAIEHIVVKDLPTWLPVLGSTATRSGVIYRTAQLRAHPFCNPQFDGSDILHLMRIRALGKSLFLPGAKTYYRIHPGATSASSASTARYRKAMRRLKKLCFLFRIDYFVRKRIFAFVRSL